jgi:UDP-N-acetylglucosamine 2-epimerase (non-hydrolysing)
MKQADNLAQVTVIFGTRPEAIKLAPVIHRLQKEPHLACRVCVTAQHRQMLDQVLEAFSLKPDTDLNLMQPGQTLGQLTARAIEALDGYLATEKPDLILVQGDTTTVFCAALAAFYHRIPVGHVEAGLRTGNLQSPWPEEANRVLTSRLTALHFAPTETARQNLLREGVLDRQLFVTGNTVIDALLWMRDRLGAKGNRAGILNGLGINPGFARDYLDDWHVSDLAKRDRKLVLVTGHRRESFGAGFRNICQAIRALADACPDVGVIYPVHLNPNVQAPVNELLGNHPRIQLISPVGYEQFVWLMSQSHFILSDSGGVQEEAPSLGKPVLVMRDTTERPEGVQAGTCRLVGTDPEKILKESMLLLGDAGEYERRSRLNNPYGDGHAAPRIVRHCLEFFGLGSDRSAPVVAEQRAGQILS